MSAAADALGAVRLAAAIALPAVIARATESGGSVVPLALFAVAAASDFLDGPLARRTGGASRHGAILDNVADVAFVLAATAMGARLGLVPWAAPGAIGLAFGAYLLASAAGSARRGAFGLARSHVGHAAGVCNYVLAGLVAGALALPGAAWLSLLRAASVVVVAVNLAAVLGRVLSRASR